jgi:hypothetical protein
MLYVILANDNEDNLIEKVEKCIDMVSDFLPELTEENINLLCTLLGKEGMNFVHPQYNFVLKKYHRLRYKI